MITRTGGRRVLWIDTSAGVAGDMLLAAHIDAYLGRRAGSRLSEAVGVAGHLSRGPAV